MNPTLAQGVLGLYGIVLALGGWMGYAKAKSRASLIAGASSAVIALAAMGVSLWDFRAGMVLGSILALMLAVFFGVRLRRTGKWMPAGMLMFVSQVVALFLLVAVLAGGGKG